MRGIGPSEKQNDFLKALRIHVWYICHKIQSNAVKIYHTWILWEGKKKSSPGTFAQVPAVGKFPGQGLGEVLGSNETQKSSASVKKALQYEKPSII